MPIPTTTAQDLDRHLGALGLPEHQKVVVHSRLISFGRIEGGVATVYEALRNAVGPNGTIAVPAYTLELAAGEPYDHLTSWSMESGALSEHVRRLPGSVRSRSPLHSHAAIGPAAGVFADDAVRLSLGPGSDFDVFRRAGFSLLLLGCGFGEGATFIHHVEALVGVPYRGWVDLPRTVVVDGVAQKRPARYYGRASAEWDEDFDKVGLALEAQGHLGAAGCPFGRSYLMRLSDLETVVTSMLHADPYALVRATGTAHG